MRAGERLQCVLDLALPLRDVWEQRVEAPDPPAWCESRGWTEFLLGLGDAELGRAEQGDSRAVLSSAPESLRALAEDVSAAVRLPALTGSAALENNSLRSVRLRKRAQLSALLDGISGMARAAERIVDVGAGSGHLTRLSAELFERRAIGIESNPERVETATSLSRGSSRVRFERLDARRQLKLEPGDVAVGLHACGELGDSLLTTASRAGCDIVLVGCCFQKISGSSRTPLSTRAAAAVLAREHLGLANLTAQARGVEAPLELSLAARQARYALTQLLRARGVELAPGAELRGVNRRQAMHGLARIAAPALSTRGLPPASDAELAHFEAVAARDYATIRRLSLPRSMLSRLLEVLVALDRAAYLEESGFSVLLATTFAPEISPRNIGIFASLEHSRLPKARMPSLC